MKRFLEIGLVAAACLALAACEGGGKPTADAGTDTFVPMDEGGEDDGLLVPDESDAADHTRDIRRDPLQEDDGVTVEDGVDVPDLPPVDPGDEVSNDVPSEEGVPDVPPTDVPPEAGDADASSEAGDDDLPPVDTCDGPACTPCPDDGKLCTKDERDPETGECVYVLQTGFCLIDDACKFRLQPSDANPCLFCVPEKTTTDFSVFEGQPCSRGDPCTSGDSCNAEGKCLAGPPTDCNDDNECTLDSCKPFVGCSYETRSSDCNDRDECTYLDRCDNQRCVGFPRNCNDSNPCTTDSCDPVLGCLNVPNSNSCNDLNACTASDTCTDKECVGTEVLCNDDNPCTRDSCNEASGGCLFQSDLGLQCSDGNECTTNDHCSRPSPLAPPYCEGYAAVCNDGSPCTLDSCDPAIGCVYTPYVPEVNPCLIASSPCTEAETCIDGECRGLPKSCDDANPCTIDSCNPVNGCHNDTTLGACDDGNPCTIGESCIDGACGALRGAGVPNDCDDDNDCTLDDCSPAVGCMHAPTAGLCQDLDPCRSAPNGICQDGVCQSLGKKDCDDNQPCTVDSCDAFGNCIHTLTVGSACDDGKPCTVGETCAASGECGAGIPRDCNDNNVCTDDTCHATLGCVYTPVPGTCSDGSVCTINDQCESGTCVGQAIVCEDANLCTDNMCDAIDGCYYPPIERTCDDANPCTVDDQCVAGTCVGISLFEDPSLKASRLRIAEKGNNGDGVDVDGSEATCQPKPGNCTKGIDNAFGPLNWMFNPEVIKANAAGTLALMLEPEGPPADGGEFRLNVFWGERIAPAACDPTTAGCNYGVSPNNLQGVCEPVYSFDNAKVVVKTTGPKLTAGGGADYEMPIFLVFGIHRIPLTLKWAKLEALVSLSEGRITSGVGALGGVVSVQAVRDGISAIPPADFPQPYSRNVILDYMDAVIKPDFDLDSDGVKESASMGWPVTLVSAHIIGPL